MSASAKPPRKRGKPGAEPVARSAFTVGTVRDPDLRETREGWTFDCAAPHTRADFLALRRTLEALTPAGRIASLRARAEALPAELPERAAMLAELARAEQALANFPGAFFRVDSFLSRASGLWERAARREVSRAARAARVRGGKEAGKLLQANKAQDHSRIRSAYANYKARGLGREAAGILARGHGLSPSQIRRIVRPK